MSMRNFQKGELLANPEDRGFPVEYLLSRLRGRRATFVRDWRALVHEASPRDVLASARPRGTALYRTPEGIWRDFLREYSWIYGQMNGGVRKVFAPFFSKRNFGPFTSVSGISKNGRRKGPANCF